MILFILICVSSALGLGAFLVAGLYVLALLGDSQVLRWLWGIIITALFTMIVAAAAHKMEKNCRDPLSPKIAAGTIVQHCSQVHAWLAPSA